MRAVYSSKARKVWFERDRLMVDIVGWMAYMMAEMGGPSVEGRRDGGGCAGKSEVTSNVSA
jgi:hypothetical protein